MAIQVLCSGCGSRFAVSDRFAGKTGPCPKCKKPITIPTPAVKAVQDEYMRLAANLWLGSDPLPSVPMKDRDIFDLLGFD